MSDKTNGGPAFPLVAQNWHREGMTLRDYVALKVLPVLIANDETEWEDDVRDALIIADKYLRARGGVE